MCVYNDYWVYVGPTCVNYCSDVIPCGMSHETSHSALNTSVSLSLSVSLSPPLSPSNLVRVTCCMNHSHMSILIVFGISHLTL